MKISWNTARAWFTALGGWVGWLLGGADALLFTLVAFVAADYVSGVMHAIVSRSLNSGIGARGIFKKVLMFVLVGAAHLLDQLITENSGVLRTAVIFFFLSNEGVSLLENAAALGLPVPRKLRDTLAGLNREAGEDETATGGE
jgi:toxin secretion/phage lysis holin